METSDIIAASSAVVALCALAATGYQTHLSHRHDKLSVQPILVWSESYVQEDHGTFLTFKLMNHGQGPALVKDRWFEVDGKRFESELGGSDLVEAVARKLLGSRVQWYLRESGLPGKAIALPAGAETIVAKTYFPKRDKEGVRTVLATCPTVDLIFQYDSLYKEGRTFSALRGVTSQKS